MAAELTVVCSNKDCLEYWRNEGSGIVEPLGTDEDHDEGDKKRPLLSRDWVVPRREEMVFCKEKSSRQRAYRAM